MCSSARPHVQYKKRVIALKPENLSASLMQAGGGGGGGAGGGGGWGSGGGFGDFGSAAPPL